MSGRFVARTTSRSARATRALGARLGRLLAPGDVVALVGDLGAGKTQLVRGVCAGAGVPPGEVSSPSFAIVATYRGRIPVHHADLYRIADEDELYATGFQDLVGGEGALLVEWADRIPGALPAERLVIRLQHDLRSPNLRRVEIDGMGNRPVALARSLARTSAARRGPSGSRSRSQSGRGGEHVKRREGRRGAASGRGGRRPRWR